MNNRLDSNIYTYKAASVLTAYAPFVEGTPNCMVAVIGSQPADQDVRNALSKSAERLGFGIGACAWITGSCADGALGPADLWTLVEGIDPVAIVVLDGEASKLVGSAYEQELVCDAKNRVLGRNVAVFADFASMLGDADAKQRAWHLLKLLQD